MIPSGRMWKSLKAKTNSKRKLPELQHKLAMSKADQSIQLPHPFQKQDVLTKRNTSIREKKSKRAIDGIIQNRNKAEEKKKKQVRFDTVEVREYARVVGDNPSIVGGFPLQLDWQYTMKSQCCVDDYEQRRDEEERSKAKGLKPLSSAERLACLKQMGHSNATIRQWEFRRKVIQTHEWAYGSNLKLPVFNTKVLVKHYVV